MPGRPVHHGHEVEKPLRHRDIGDVRAPHVVRPQDREVAQQVGEDPVLRARHAGARPPVHCLHPHEAHEPPDPVVATRLSLKSLARRILDLNDEIAELDRFIAPLAEELAPYLLKLEGVGIAGAGELLTATGENPDRLRSQCELRDAAPARCPLPAARLKREDANATVSIAVGSAEPTQRQSTFLGRRRA